MSELADRMMNLARDLSAQPDQEQTLDHVIQTTHAMVPSAEHDGITLTRRRGITTAAANGPIPTRSDELQVELDEGPCLDAIRTDPLIVTHDLSREDRWPRWASAVNREFGVHSMMCVRLFTHEDTVGAMNVFSTVTHAFDAGDRDQVQAVAAHAAVAVAAAGQIEDLKLGMATRTVTAQAVGMVMSRYDLTADTAFEVLKRISSEQNRKLNIVASELIADHEAQVRASC